MTINILLLAFLGFSVYWWSLQGLFSSALSFLLTLMAAIMALAFWEHLAAMLSGVMPDAAFGVGLLLPFGVSLLVMRVLFDTYVPGNLQFHPLADKIGGGAFGLFTGMLGAGVLIIGLQFIGGPGTLMGYRGWVLGADGQPTSATKEVTGLKTAVVPLWLKVDVMAAGLLTSLSNGSFSPILSNGSLGRYHPDLAVEASFYAQGGISSQSKAEGRHGLNPAHVRIPAENGYFSLATPPSKLEDVLEPSHRTVIVGTEIELQPTDGTRGEADRDSHFRVMRHQVALGFASEGGQTSLSYPTAYIQDGSYIDMVPGEYGRSDVSIQKVSFHWVFQIPVSAEPRWFRIKGVRMALEGPSPSATGDLADSLIQEIGSQIVVNPEIDPPDITAGEKFAVSDRLPFTLDKNVLGTAVETSKMPNLEGLAIVSGQAFVAKGKGRIGKTLMVTRIFHSQGAQIVQIRLDSRATAGSLIGQVLQRAASVTQAPVIVDENNEIFFAMGYGVQKGTAGFKFSIDANQPLRSMSQIDPGSIGSEDRLILYYQIGEGRTLTRVMHGDQELLNLNYLKIGGK